ncbi:MAG: hypothetical protein TREMPRED_001084 [Tremellales sp. Tagirdzhanova-0007]|nr:MAG: hypothetical protein TREMPRED_001084 [Tremellales sp. Tagirdzhanova-0007]
MSSNDIPSRQVRPPQTTAALVPSTTTTFQADIPTNATRRLSTFNPNPSPSKPVPPAATTAAKDVVDTLLAQLEGRFDEMSEQVL